VHVAQLWRYPVKSMAGERLDRADLRPDGVAGDRVVHVRGPHGRAITARSSPRLLTLRATLGPDGEPLVDGRPWTADGVARDVEAAAGDGARLVRYDGLVRFDILPLLVATDGAIAAFGRDGRRLRPNLVIAGVDGLAEREWEGREMHVGDAVIALEDLRERCIMTTVDPDTNARDVEVLQDIRRRFGGRLCLNARVVRPAKVAVGDPVAISSSAAARSERTPP
jgi:hypothetical protein